MLFVWLASAIVGLSASMPLQKNHSRDQDQLFAIAQGQSGFFTAKQAEAAGFQRRNHSYHVRAGNWAREGRGIFRLQQFPVSDEADLVLWSLWSRDRSDQPAGVYSHETALRIYDLSDLMPAKLHMTVPKTFRRSAPVPGVLVLHRGNLDTSELEEREGHKVTRPIKTIIDLINAGTLAEETVRSAFAEAVQKGLITQREIAQNQDALACVIAATRLPQVS
jgi:predicted transcriptional regulator of viral defense system